MNMTKNKNRFKGFTLVELLVVMAILGILVSLVAGNFRSAQVRGRDVTRKSDLKQIAHSLELFYADYGKYPLDSSGLISACPYNPLLSTGVACSWGEDSFTDGKTVYFKVVPSDPSSDYSYFYRIVPGSSNQKFQLFAYLENSKDPEIITTSHLCGGGKNCNFAITSTNTDFEE